MDRNARVGYDSGMTVSLAYGKGRKHVRFPEGAAVTVVEPVRRPGLADPTAAIVNALRAPIGSPPLARLVGPADTVGVVFSDITRPAPNLLLVPAVLEELRSAGVPDSAVTLFNATGTHRPSTEAELVDMLGRRIVSSYRIVQNDARATGDHVKAGTTASGNDVWINAAFMACSRKVLTGFIEPHFFAGFSGGAKAILPGLARLDTVMRNHGSRSIDDPAAGWAVLDGNPVHREIADAAGLVRPDFLLNVALNGDKEVTAVFAGDVAAAHAEGARFVRATSMVEVDGLFDVVVTSNSGYPLDRNLYQSVKGMSAAARIVRPGGAIVLAAECCDGLPDHGSFGRLLAEAGSLDDLLARIRAPGFAMDDQWQAQILALIAKKADVYVHSDGLTEQQILDARLRPCADIEALLAELVRKRGRGARICALPEGPQTVACPKGRNA
jgi:lactate racemase